MRNSRLLPLSETRRAILVHLKRQRVATIGELALELDISGEAVRQQIVQLERDGWVRPQTGRKDRRGRTGRPAALFGLTRDGDHLFPKEYDTLAVELLDAVSGGLSRRSLLKVLATLADTQVRRWEPRLMGLDFKQRVQALSDYYSNSNGFAEVEKEGTNYRILQRNCPYLNVAQQRPVICSVTVNVLTRLLGHKVVREERMQSDGGRCAFRVLSDSPIEAGEFPFTLESS